MKKFTHILGILLAISALSLTACKKKPVRGPEDANAMGNTVDPNSVAVASDIPSGLDQRHICFSRAPILTVL